MLGYEVDAMAAAHVEEQRQRRKGMEIKRYYGTFDPKTEPPAEYVLAADYDRERQRRMEAEAVMERLREYGGHDGDCLWHEGMPDIDTPQRCSCAWPNAQKLYRAHLAKYKEVSHG